MKGAYKCGCFVKESLIDQATGSGRSVPELVGQFYFYFFVCLFVFHLWGHNGLENVTAGELEQLQMDSWSIANKVP